MSPSKFVKSANTYLDPERIRTARMRRGLTKVELARTLSVTARTISKYEEGGAPASVADGLGDALSFPAGYFSQDVPPLVTADEVRFRAARRATARERAVAVASGISGVEVDKWISARFALPVVDIPPFEGNNSRIAANLLREAWGLGSRPLPNLVQLCESRGIRVYTLPAVADAVDAFSIWRDDVPYVFLARRKSPERTRFDLAHELGHLVLHGNEGDSTAEQEREADSFASEFLIPRNGVIEYVRSNPSVDEILAARSAFKMSAMALTFAAHNAGRMTDWSYRQSCIELSKRGFRSSEPGGMPQHEVSRVFPQVLGSTKFGGAREIAADLDLPLEDVHALTFGVELRTAKPSEPSVDETARRSHSRHLRVASRG